MPGDRRAATCATFDGSTARTDVDVVSYERVPPRTLVACTPPLHFPGCGSWIGDTSALPCGDLSGRIGPDAPLLADLVVRHAGFAAVADDPFRCGLGDVAATAGVLGSGDDFEVVDVDAELRLAEVVDGHAVRDGASGLLVGGAMDEHGLPLLACSDGAVASALDGSLPDVAWGIEGTWG